MFGSAVKPTEKSNDTEKVKELEKQISSLESQYLTIVSQLNQKEIEIVKLEEKLETVRIFPPNCDKD